MLPSNLEALTERDEVKFVIATWEDYAWAKAVLRDKRIADRCEVLMSWASPLSDVQRDPTLKTVDPAMTPIGRRELAEAVIADRLPARFQLQAHKIIWDPAARGV